MHNNTDNSFSWALEYKENHNDILIQGFSYSGNDLDQLASFITHDRSNAGGEKEFQDYMSSISDTKFQDMKVNKPTTSAKWQTGEDLTSAFLTKHFSCSFPWPSSRDLKNPNASLSGADLVGFHKNRFLFGEVKTSSENRYPSKVTSNTSSGLNAQLNKLCSDEDLRWTLIIYLFHRLKDDGKFKEATKHYLKNNKNFFVFGVLLRDIEPKIKDWDYLKSHLKPHERNKVFLIALYLPVDNGIQTLSQLILEKESAT